MSDLFRPICPRYCSRRIDLASGAAPIATHPSYVILLQMASAVGCFSTIKSVMKHDAARQSGRGAFKLQESGRGAIKWQVGGRLQDCV